MGPDNHPPLRRSHVLEHAQGLHARPCLVIADTVARFQSDVRIHVGPRVADASSVLDLLALGAPEGSVLDLEADGPDAEAALDALVALLRNDFAPGAR